MDIQDKQTLASPFACAIPNPHCSIAQRLFAGLVYTRVLTAQLDIPDATGASSHQHQVSPTSAHLRGNNSTIPLFTTVFDRSCATTGTTGVTCAWKTAFPQINLLMFDSPVPTLAAQLAGLRDTGTFIRVWGELVCPTINAFGKGITVNRIGIVGEALRVRVPPPTPAPTPVQSQSEPVEDWWEQETTNDQRNC
jgi:hypothetical protein